MYPEQLSSVSEEVKLKSSISPNEPRLELKEERTLERSPISKMLELDEEFSSDSLSVVSPGGAPISSNSIAVLFISTQPPSSNQKFSIHTSSIMFPITSSVSALENAVPSVPHSPQDWLTTLWYCTVISKAATPKAIRTIISGSRPPSIDESPVAVVIAVVNTDAISIVTSDVRSSVWTVKYRVSSPYGFREP